MKALLSALFFFSLIVSPTIVQADDEDTLAKLIQDSETFFDESTVGKIFFNWDEDGNTVTTPMPKAEIAQLVLDLKKVPVVWSIDKAEKCSSLSLSTASQGACLIRNLQLALAHFYVNFQETKKVLRSKGDEGIEASKKLSQSVKSMTVYNSLMCDLGSTSWWGGSGSVAITYGCLMSVTDQGIQWLTQVRSMATDPKNQEVLNAQIIGKSSVLDIGTLQQGVSYAQETVKYLEAEISTQVEEYFKEFSEGAIQPTRDLLSKTTELFVGASADYCSAYVAIVLPTFKDQSKYGDKVRASCMKKITEKRSNELNDVYQSISTVE